MTDRSSWALVSVRIKSDPRSPTTVFARRHQFPVGPPITFDREEPEVSSMEYLAGAIASDLIGTLRKVARSRRVPIEEVEAVVQGELNNALTFLGVVGEEGEPSLKKIRVKLYLGTSARREEIDQIWGEVLDRSPLYTTLRKAVEIEIEVQPSY